MKVLWTAVSDSERRRAQKLCWVARSSRTLLAYPSEAVKQGEELPGEFELKVLNWMVMWKAIPW